jgi:arginine/lysine/ornithine decarboxylase
MPTRNGYGIIGPIPPGRLQPDTIRQDITASPLGATAPDRNPVHAVITNSTYDGLCYKVSRIEGLLGQSLDRLHFDEAWYGYARFHPLYRERFAMHGEAQRHGADQPTVFATQSTHKLLAALSQASMIHIRDGRRPIPHARFNEAYMMHASTSPLYPMIASLDISAAMMAGPGGTELMEIAIREAVAFRCALARRHAEHQANGDWFFAPWQPDTFTDPETGQRMMFHEVPAERLASDPRAWELAPGDAWHGFEELEDDYCMLDPIKVSILTPGASPTGGLADRGIPATLVSAYLAERGIIAEKTADFSILFLFSLGITEGKWGTLINAFYEFKHDYDRNAPVSQTLPSLAARCGGIDAEMGLRDLGDALFATMRDLGTTSLMARAFSGLPEPIMTPARAYELLVQDQVELVALDQLPGRIVATGVAPYPPGIPLLMPGENAGPGDGAVLGYLRALETFDRRFPGFEHDIHGVEVEDGRYHILCLREGVG